MTLILGIFLLFLHREVAGDLPPCFSNETSWHSSDMEDAVQNIDTPFICQELCAVSNCIGFTWYSEQNQLLPKLCILYHTLGKEEHCEHCVSGPGSCACSGSFGCRVTDDNLIDTIAPTESETKCQNICFNTPGCTFYTYYNYLNILEDFCYIFNSCEVTDDSCDGCFSGPSVCSSSTTSTTATSTATVTATAVTSTTTAIIHNECDDIDYKILDDETRSVNYGYDDRNCDNTLDYPGQSPDWEGTGWYRMKSPAGVRMPESPPSDFHCNTIAPGWLRGEHPQTLFEEITATACFNYFGNSCDHPRQVKVKNCGEYYLYNLPDTYACYCRYCAE